MVKIAVQNTIPLEEVLQDFLLAKKAAGLADKTLKTYQQHFSAIGKHLDMATPIGEVTREKLDTMIVSMRNASLAPTSIKSYVRSFKAFLSWCNEEGITRLTMRPYKASEPIKELYTDEELLRLLKKPDMKRCGFTEYRSWVIVNLLINSGCRAATVRNIKIKDVDLPSKIIYLRHTKNGHAQTTPLCAEMVKVLKEYIRVRGGAEEDYLFCNDVGEPLSEYAMYNSIAAYNKRRGVLKTSIHAFRHTFARTYLVDCPGNAFTLQHLLGHSTLEMTKPYCAIFYADISREYDSVSPLAQLQGKQKHKIKMHK